MPGHSLDRELRSSWRLVAAVLLALLGFIVAATAYLALAVEPRVGHALDVVRELRCVHTAMLDRETGLRAYLGTGTSEFLEPVEAGEASMRSCHDALLRAAAAEGATSAPVVETLVLAGTWEREWASPARPAQQRRTGSDLSAFLLEGKQAFDAYRAGYDYTLALAIERRDAAVALEQRVVKVMGGTAAGIVLAVLLVDVRRRRRLQRAVDAPVQGLFTMMGRVQGGELGVQPPATAVAEFRSLGEGIAALARRLEREQAQGMLREETAKRLAGRLEVVLRVARETAGSPSPSSVAETVAAAAVELGRVQAVVWLMAEDGSFTAVLPSAGALPRARGGAHTVPGALVAACVAEVHPLREGDRACFPLVVGGGVVGVLDVHDEAWDDDDAAQVDQVLEALARFAAVALDSARLHAQTIEQARTDALTGLRNRRSLDAELPVEWQRSRRYDRPLSVVMLDLDHFKRVNDTAGHAVGDEWLRLTGGVVLGRLRTSDAAYRYGGEELVVLLPETDAEAALIVAERLREAVETCGGPAAYPVMTMSVGLATADAGMRGPADLLAAADAALYAAKASGRNQVVCASPWREPARQATR